VFQKWGKIDVTGVRKNCDGLTKAVPEKGRRWVGRGSEIEGCLGSEVSWNSTFATKRV